jgi:mono/diheme cytochrome c family protein
MKKYGIQLVAVVVALAWAASAYAVRQEMVQSGMALYDKYCTSCHGSDGRGKGPQAAGLPKAPTDLTQLKKQHQGKYPAMDVLDRIDGSLPVATHGDPPPWTTSDLLTGPVGPDQNSFLRGRLILIVEYLSTIQAK